MPQPISGTFSLAIQRCAAEVSAIPQFPLEKGWQPGLDFQLLFPSKIFESFDLSLAPRRPALARELFTKVVIGGEVVAGNLFTGQNHSPSAKAWSIPVHVCRWVTTVVQERVRVLCTLDVLVVIDLNRVPGGIRSPR
jgi:hypothetical protein